jgi:hypothetical protein
MEKAIYEMIEKDHLLTIGKVIEIYINFYHLYF